MFYKLKYNKGNREGKTEKSDKNHRKSKFEN